MEFHIEMIRSLCDVAQEVRIFPLFNSHGELPSILGPLMHHLTNQNIGLEINAVSYQFQMKGNAMLRLWAQTCEIN